MEHLQLIVHTRVKLVILWDPTVSVHVLLISESLRLVPATNISLIVSEY